MIVSDYHVMSSRGQEIEPGDYMIADGALYDDFTGDTFRVDGFGSNLVNQLIVHVSNIKTGTRTVFYPGELSHEDWTPVTLCPLYVHSYAENYG